MDCESFPKSSTTIVDLPEHVLVHILSFLYTPQAILTSLVSRKFRNLWHSIPSLHFDIFDFYSCSTSPGPRTCSSRQLFAEFISRALLVRPPNSLEKLELTFEYTNYHQHKFYVQSWIRNAINLSVSELIINLYYDENCKWKDHSVDDNGKCHFLFELLNLDNSSIEFLKLYFCHLKFPASTNPVKFASLKSLDLFFVPVNGNGVCDLVARCVNLEYLRIRGVYMESLSICSANLKEFCLEAGIDPPVSIELCCPSLRKITLSSIFVSKISSMLMIELEEVSLSLMSFINSNPYADWMTVLSLFSNVSQPDLWYEHLESNNIPSSCEQFAPNLKHLELNFSYNEDDLNGLAALLKLLPKLEILGIHKDCEDDDHLSGQFLKASVVFKIPCLRQVILRNYYGTKNERHFVKLFKKNGLGSERIKLLHPSSREKEWRKKMMSQKGMSA